MKVWVKDWLMHCWLLTMVLMIYSRPRTNLATNTLTSLSSLVEATKWDIHFVGSTSKASTGSLHDLIGLPFITWEPMVAHSTVEGYSTFKLQVRRCQLLNIPPNCLILSFKYLILSFKYLILSCNSLILSFNCWPLLRHFQNAQFYFRYNIGCYLAFFSPSSTPRSW